MADNDRLLMRLLGLLVLLVIAWLLWSGIFKTLLFALGAFSCVLTLYLAKRLGFFRKASGLHLLPRLPHYWFKLMKDIVISSIDVAKIVLTPSLPISPTIITLKAAPEGPIGQAILGNSITLSPGTVTLDVHEGELMVHCLTTAGAEEILAGDINRRSAALTKS